MTRALIVSTAMLLTMTACADNSGTDAQPASATPTTTTSPTARDEYSSAQQLVAGLNTAGIACINWERTDSPIGALERGTCYAGEDGIVASIYSSHADAVGAPSKLAALASGVVDISMVVGGNWTLSCDTEQLCQQVEADFGGDLVVIPA